MISIHIPLYKQLIFSILIYFNLLIYIFTFQSHLVKDVLGVP